MHQPVEPKVRTDGEGWAVHIYSTNTALTCGSIRPKHGQKEGKHFLLPKLTKSHGKHKHIRPRDQQRPGEPGQSRRQSGGKAEETVARWRSCEAALVAAGVCLNLVATLGSLQDSRRRNPQPGAAGILTMLMNKSLYSGLCGAAAAHGSCEGLQHTHGPL
jgi:hypothetical protein